MKLLIAGGGTGGHVFPAIAIAREWLSRGGEREVVLVGTQRGLEMKLVPQAGLPLETLRVAGLKGKGGATLVKKVRKSQQALASCSLAKSLRATVSLQIPVRTKNIPGQPVTNGSAGPSG